MKIRLRSTGQVFYEEELRKHMRENDGPSWNETTPEVLEAIQADAVLDGVQPQPTRYQFAFADGVEQIDGIWYTKYSVADMSAEAVAAKNAEQAKNMRVDRNKKLTACDWTQLPDSAVDRQAWATYRAALRDVPSQSGFPWDIDWPSKPS